MPASAAAIEGIGANGLAWKARISLGEGVDELGAFNDQYEEGEDIDHAEVEKSALKIVERLKAIHEKHDWARDLDFKGLAGDLEAVADDEIEAINYEMNRIYDVCDFNRILISNG